MKRITRIVTLILCLILAVVPAFAGNAAAETARALRKSGGNILSRDFPAGESLSDWRAFALARSGCAGDYQAYAKALRTAVEQAYRENGVLDETRATEYHRTILTVLALGEDPRAFGEKPNGEAIDLVADGVLDFSEPGAQGLNGVCYALIALHASGVRDAQTEARLCGELLAAQEADGGFGLIAGSSEVDITAMAVQALAPYRAEYADAITAALGYLAGEMTDSCGFPDGGAESIAQVILALTALELDPRTELRFMRGEQNLVTALERFRDADGAYRHMADSTESDCYATVQCLLALEAMARLENGMAGIYEFTAEDAPLQKNAHAWLLPAGLALCAVLAGCGICRYRRKKRNGTINGSDIA